MEHLPISRGLRGDEKSNCQRGGRDEQAVMSRAVDVEEALSS